MSSPRVSRKLYVCVLLLLCLQAVSAAPPLDTSEATAESAFSNGHYQQAIVHYQRLLHERPADIGYRTRLAESYEVSGNLELAQEHASAVLQKQSRNSEALMVMGRTHGRQGEWGDAKAFYERAVQADKNNAAAHLNLGQALMQLGNDQEAEAQFTEYRRLTGITQP